GRITSQGKLLQQDTFSVTEQENNFLSRVRERRVFLFEQLVIFSEPIERKKGFLLPGYTFKNSIKVSCLGAEPSTEPDATCFVLTSRKPDGSAVRFQLQATSPHICRSWLDDVNQILESQRTFLNALQSPIEYQRRESKSSSLGRSIRPPPCPGLRPHSSASIDRHKLPVLQPHNTSLPSLYLGGHGAIETLPQWEPAFSDRAGGVAVSNGLCGPTAHCAQSVGEGRRGFPAEAMPGGPTPCLPAPSGHAPCGHAPSGHAPCGPAPLSGRRSNNLTQLAEDDL
ncbi:hypothetical protein CRUP_000931, partial [Coryphaenoides rupestris]